MKRLLTACAAAIALLAIPAAASAQTGAVLRVNRAHHKLEIVDATHAVHSYAARPGRRAARKLRAGVKVSFQASGGRITALHVDGRARKIAFLGKVVSSGSKGVVLRLGDGQQLRLGKRQFGTHRKRAQRSSVQINLQGLDPGQVVLITETADSAGNVTITIKLVPGADQNGDDKDVTGTISALGANSVTIQADDGSAMTFQADPMLLEDFEVGDAVDVTYYADAGGSLVADDLEPVDDGSGADDLDALGTVTALDPTGGSITVQVAGGSAMTFEADADLLDGVAVGDYVDVTYFQDTDGSLVADDVEPAGTAGDDSGD